MTTTTSEKTAAEAVVQRRRAIHDARLVAGVNVDGLLADAEAVGNIDLIAQTHITLGAVAVAVSDYQQLSTHMQSATRLLKLVDVDSWLGPESSLVGALFAQQGHWYESLGRIDEAIKWMGVSFDHFARTGDQSNARNVWFHLCDLEVSNGNLTGSALLHQRMIGWSVVPVQILASSYYQLARLALADDDLATAREKVDRAAEMTTQLMPCQVGRMEILRARIALAADDVEEATWALTHPVFDEGSDHGSALALVKARLAIRQGEFDEAERVLIELGRVASTQFAVATFGAIAIGLAELALAKGFPLRALDELAEFDSGRTPYGDRVDELRIRAIALEQAGRPKEAVDCLAELAEMRAHGRRPASMAPDSGVDVPHPALDRLLDETFEHIREAEAAELLRQKRELLGFVAHDLRGALSVAQFVQPRLASESLTPDERSSAVATMRQATKTMRSVVDALGVLLTIDGSLYNNTRPTHISSIVHDVVGLATELANQKGQTILLQDESSPDALVRPDRDAVSLIASNLLSNAVKYSPRDACIEVGVREWRDEAETDWIVVEVRDFGQGILDEDMSSIWKRYTTASASPTSNESSFGLGLYTARQLCESMGGVLRADSGGLGQGSRFELRLPMARLCVGRSEVSAGQ